MESRHFRTEQKNILLNFQASKKDPEILKGTRRRRIDFESHVRNC